MAKSALAAALRRDTAVTYALAHAVAHALAPGDAPALRRVAAAACDLRYVEAKAAVGRVLEVAAGGGGGGGGGAVEAAARAAASARQLGAASRSRVTANLWRRFYAVVRSRM